VENARVSRNEEFRKDALRRLSRSVRCPEAHHTFGINDKLTAKMIAGPPNIMSEKGVSLRTMREFLPKTQRPFFFLQAVAGASAISLVGSSNAAELSLRRL